MSRLELHHRIPDFALVICDGSRSGKTTLNHYTQKEKKPEFCFQCGHWNRRCTLGYVTERKSKACNQAVPAKEMIKRRL